MFTLYCVEVDGAEGFFDKEGPSSVPDSLLFLSAPPRYFLPVMQATSCLAHTAWCLFPKMLLILYAHVAANNLVGLFIFSSFIVLAMGLAS